MKILKKIKHNPELSEIRPLIFFPLWEHLKNFFNEMFALEVEGKQVPVFFLSDPLNLILLFFRKERFFYSSRNGV